MATFSDDFNRANGAVGNGWLSAADYAIVSNELNPTGANAVIVCPLEVATGYYDISVTVRSTSDACRLLIGATDAGSTPGTRLIWWPGDGWYVENASTVEVGFSSDEATAGTHDVRYVRDGDNHTITVDTVPLLAFTDSSTAHGYVALEGSEGSFFDDFLLSDGGSSLGGTLMPAVWNNKWALEALTI